eukprot:COSAG05_NODE_9329_length_631_cov_1.765038_1_plen_61_part_10
MPATGATAEAQRDIIAAVHATIAGACPALVRRASPTGRRVQALAGAVLISMDVKRLYPSII